MASIAIIDQDQESGDALAQTLSSRGHECTVFHLGKKGFNKMLEEPPALLILDVMLDDISGFHLCRLVRGSSRLHMTPILVLSAMDNEEEIHHAMAQGADEYLTKPSDPAVVVNRAEALIASHAQSKGIDENTELVDSEGTKREIQRRIIRGEKFGLVYMELLGLRVYTELAGAEKRDRVIRHLSRAITRCSRPFRGNIFFAGHMGMGHFLCAVPLDNLEPYCQEVQRIWDDHRTTISATLGLDDAEEDDCLSVAFYVTRHVSGYPDTAQNLIEVLMRLRGNLMRLRENEAATTQAGIHLDRRDS